MKRNKMSAPFKRGDVVQYTVKWRDDPKYQAANRHHETSIGIVTRVHEEDHECDISWISHNFSHRDVSGDYETGWSFKVLIKIDHVDIDDEKEVGNVKGRN